MGMTDREKVLHGLSSCGNDYGIPNICEVTECPYRETGAFCVHNLAHDASMLISELLKAQEPRVMTLEEVKDFNWDYCYLEEERLPGKEYRAVCGDYALTCITWPSVTSMRIQHGDESYGKEWRCWTSRPTDEQRSAIPWE